MTVYVDDMMAPFGRMLMSHLYSDESVEELHEMARKLGLKSRTHPGVDFLAGDPMPCPPGDTFRILPPKPAYQGLNRITA